MYFYTLSNFAWITQIDCQLAKSHATKRGNSQGWFWNELEAIFKKRLHDESNEIRLRILALGIYRLRCCLQLLFVWTVSHMNEGKISGLVGTPWHL